MASKPRNIRKNAPKVIERDLRRRRLETSVLARGLIFNEADYQYSDKWVAGNTSNPFDIHSTAELMECMAKNKNIGIEARVICPSHTKDAPEWRYAKLNREAFISHSKTRVNSRKLREAIDAFGTDQDAQFGGSGAIGDDFTPLLGGPFSKQLYYTDYLRMHSVAFHAWNHDPFAKATIEITKNFVLGRGFKVKWTKSTTQVLWDAFCRVTKFNDLVEDIAKEISIYGEVMVWKLPDFRKFIVQRPVPGDTIPVGLLPRYRLIDPSVIWEIVTHPEDITRVLYYQWVAPTQYQLYTDGRQPSLKFLYQQIPANEVIHHKVNSVSNEKRGRSDLFAALGYMKRLRDSVNYSIIALQKAAAWAIDTTVQGDENDMDQYIQQQLSSGTIAPAGSEFVHTDAIKRDYMSNEGASKGGNSQAFDWALTMGAMAVQIPVGYYGTHLGGEQTRAGALVATEPVALKMESRQNKVKQVIEEIADDFARVMGIKDDQSEITFPEIVRDDRSQKLRDLSLSQSSGWIARETSAEIAGKELQIDNYDYKAEKIKMDEDQADQFIPGPMASPLTSPGLMDKSKLSLTSNDKKEIKGVK